MKVNVVVPPFLRPDIDSLWLLAPNERELFAYWRLSDRTGRLVRLHTDETWASLPRVLRIYETGAPAPAAVWEADIEPSGALYARGVRSGAVYTADIGYRSGEGAFIALCRSAPAAVPGVRTAGAAGVPESGLSFRPFRDKRFNGYTLYGDEKQDGGRSS